jgi:hypothetical protein
MRIAKRTNHRRLWSGAAVAALLGVLALVLLAWLVVIPATRVQAVATVTTQASATLSADTAGGAYTALAGPVLQEGAAGDVSGGVGSTIVLSPPGGFEFNPAATVTVSVSPTTAGGVKIDDNAGCTSASASETAAVAAGTITVYLCTASTTPSTITWSGIAVRPTSGGPFDTGLCGVPTFPSGNIIHIGTAVILGAPTFGVLTETSGAPTSIVVTTPLGNGTVNSIVGPMTVCVEDQFGNPAVGAPMTWGISSVPAGATCQELIASDATTDGQGNAFTSLRLGHLDGNYQVSASSGAAGPTTDVSMASGGPGALCATPTFTPTNTPTPSAETPTPTPTPSAVPGEVDLVVLAAGCNPVASTYPNDTPIGDIAAAVSPSYALFSIWELDAGAWRGYSALYPELAELSEVNFLDVLFICMDEPGTLERPLFSY